MYIFICSTKVHQLIPAESLFKLGPADACCNRTFNIAVSDFDANTSASYGRVLVVTDLLLNGIAHFTLMCHELIL